MNEIITLSNIYMVIASIATVLFIIKMSLFFISGADVEVDADFDSLTDTDISFNFISIQSILAFFMGFGWSGLSALIQFNASWQISLLVAILVGLFFMYVSAYLMFLTRKLEKNIKINYSELEGKKGRAYTSFSPKSKGQIEIDVNGKLSILDAYNNADENIPSFSQIKVEKVENNCIYIIKD